MTNTGKMAADDVVLGFLVPPNAGKDGVSIVPYTLGHHSQEELEDTHQAAPANVTSQHLGACRRLPAHTRRLPQGAAPAALHQLLKPHSPRMRRASRTYRPPCR